MYTYTLAMDRVPTSPSVVLSCLEKHEVPKDMRKSDITQYHQRSGYSKCFEISLLDNEI